MMDANVKYNVGSLTEETLRKLEASGLRMTVQRRHIIEILTNSQSTSPKELWYEAMKSVPDLGIATVYRLINRLEQIGVLSKARNLSMQPVEPKLGQISDQRGRAILNLRKDLKLEDIIKDGLAEHGLQITGKNVKLSLVGDKINISIV